MNKKIIIILHFIFILSLSSAFSHIHNIDWDAPERNLFDGCLLTLDELMTGETQSVETYIANIAESTCQETYHSALIHIMTMASHNNPIAQNYLENDFFHLLNSIQNMSEDNDKKKKKFCALIAYCIQYKHIYKMPILYFALCKKYYALKEYCKLIPYAETLYKETDHPHKNVFYGLSILRFAQSKTEIDYSLSILESEIKNGTQVGNFLIKEVSQILNEKMNLFQSNN